MAMYTTSEASFSVINGYRGGRVRVNKISLVLQFGKLPPREYAMFITPIPKYILGMDVVAGLVL